MLYPSLVNPFLPKRIHSFIQNGRLWIIKMSTKIITSPEMSEELPETTKFQNSWVLWYFDPRNKDWALQNYKMIADITTPQRLWTIIAGIPKEAIECGYFFFMRKGFRPIWEVPENEQGGSWSKKVPTKDIYDIAIDLMVHCAADAVVPTRSETLVGFSTSPKGEFNIVKIWNTTIVASSVKLLNAAITHFPITPDVVYTAHKSRR
jgi:hypothetical protein